MPRISPIRLVHIVPGQITSRAQLDPWVGAPPEPVPDVAVRPRATVITARPTRAWRQAGRWSARMIRKRTDVLAKQRRPDCRKRRVLA